jgi:hypothetical protein
MPLVVLIAIEPCRCLPDSVFKRAVPDAAYSGETHRPIRIHRDGDTQAGPSDQEIPRRLFQDRHRSAILLDQVGRIGARERRLEEIAVQGHGLRRTGTARVENDGAGPPVGLRLRQEIYQLVKDGVRRDERVLGRLLRPLLPRSWS